MTHTLYANGKSCPRCPHDAHGSARCDEIDGPSQDRCLCHGVPAMPTAEAFSGLAPRQPEGKPQT